jgi:thioredoxin-like negative regulator of GroEL
VPLAVPEAHAQAGGSEAILRRADQLAAQGRLGPARAEYERALSAGAALEKDFARSRTLGLAYLHAAPQDFERAARWLEAAWKLRPSETDVRFHLAQAFSWGRNYEPAIVHFRALAESDPERTEYATGLALALHWSGDHDGSFAVLDRYLERSPGDIAVRLEYARLLGYAQRYVEAFSQYQVVLQADQHNAAALTGMAKVQSWQGDLQAAIRGFDRVLSRHAGYYDAMVGRGLALMWLGRRDEARQQLQAAQRQQPRDPDVLAALKELGPAPRPVQPTRPVADAGEVEVAQAPAPGEVAPAAEEPALPPPPVNPIPALLAAGEGAAARGNYTSAIHYYHQVLQHEPGHKEARLQIARVLSWSRDYEAAAEEYGSLLQMAPAHHQARQERARVLSWAQQFDESLAEYARLVAALKAGAGEDAPNLREVLLEQARVLSWARRYEESLAVLEDVLPAGYQPIPEDREALLTRARVLSWSRRYDEALVGYDAVLKLNEADYDARLGKAQTLYWSGELPQAAALLRPLRQQQPEHGDINFTLAAVEHGLGYNARALNLLDRVKDNQDADDLRLRIRGQLRPMMHLRLGWANARETSAADPSAVPPVPAIASTTRFLRYDATLEFNIHPDVRMEVSNTVAQNLTSNATLSRFGSYALSTQTMARLSFRVAPGFHLTVGAGGGSAGRGMDSGVEQPRSYHLLYVVRPSLTHGNWRVDFAATRTLTDYTPIAAHQSAVQRREAAALTYSTYRLRAGGEFWHAGYSMHIPDATLASQSFTTTANGGNLYVTPALYRDDRLLIEAGARYDIFGFADDTGAKLLAMGPLQPLPSTVRDPASTGFFTPGSYQRIAATGRMVWNVTPYLLLDVDGSYGPQRIANLPGIPGPDPAFRRTFAFGGTAAFTVKGFRPSITWNYFSTDTAFGPGFTAAAQGGSYKAHAVTFGLSRRF